MTEQGSRGPGLVLTAESDATKIEESIQKAMETKRFEVADWRPPIKLAADAAKIVIAIPIGDKDDPDLFKCPDCEKHSFGVVKCPHCGKDHDARKKVRRAGLVPMEWALNFVQTVPPLLCSMQIMVRKSVLSGQARNEMTYLAVKQKAKYIVYWDDDTIIPHRAIMDMHRVLEMNPDIGIVSGVYTTREDLPEPLVYKHQGEGAYWGFSAEPGVLEDIFAAGAGCMMARVEALEDVERFLGGPWWSDEQNVDAIERGDSRILWGHDIRFCRRMWEAGMNPEAKQHWRVVLAGWIQAWHFDLNRQVAYGLPKDAPCFKNANTQSYWDYLWKMEGYSTPRQYPALYDRIVELTPKESNVVDFGCGIGVLLDRLIKQKKVEAFGVDISQKAIDMLKTRWIDGEVGDAKDWEYKPGSGIAHPNVFISTETMEHLDDGRMTNLLQQASKADLAIFSVPEGDLPGTPKGEHQQVFEADQMKTLLQGHFENVTIEKIARHEGSDQNILLALCEAGKRRNGDAR